MKKANITDIVGVVIILFTILLTVFVMYQFMDGFKTQVNTNPALNSTQNKQFVSDYNSKYLAGWDYGILILVVLFPILSFVLARKLPVDTTMMIFITIFLVFFFIAMMIVSNVYGGFMDNSTFATFISQTTYIPIIFPNLPYYALIYTFLVMVGLFARGENQ